MQLFFFFFFQNSSDSKFFHFSLEIVNQMGEGGGDVVLPVSKTLWKSRSALHCCEVSHNSKTTSLMSFSGLPIDSCNEF